MWASYRPTMSASATVPWVQGLSLEERNQMPEGTKIELVGSDTDEPPLAKVEFVTDAARLREREIFLRELAEARALLARNTLWRGRRPR